MRVGFGVREGGGGRSVVGGGGPRLQLAVKDASRRGAFRLVVREETDEAFWVCARGVPRAYRHTSVHREGSEGGALRLNGSEGGLPLALAVALALATAAAAEGEEAHENDDEEHGRDDDLHNHYAGLVE